MLIATTFEFMYFTAKEFFGKLLEEKEIAIQNSRKTWIVI